MHLASKIQASGQGSLSPNAWISVDILGYVGDELPKVNQIVLSSGRLPSNENETLLMKSLAEEDGLTLGDSVTVFSFGGEVSFIISGLIESIEYSSFQLSQSGLLMLSEKGCRMFTFVALQFRQRNIQIRCEQGGL